MSPPLPRGTSRQRKIVHVAMDFFFAAIEQRDRDEWAGRPLIVGGDPGRNGTVESASSEALASEIRPGMSTRVALRLCPAAIRVPPDYERYCATATRLNTIFYEYTDLIETLSLDEAFLDITFNKPDIPFGARVAKLIKADIRRELRLPASVGAAPNKFLARLASAAASPDGLVAILPDEVAEFLHPRSVDRLPGIGRRTLQRLAELGIATIGQLAELSRDDMIRIFGHRGSRLWELAQGRDEEPVEPDGDLNSIDQETTFPTDVYAADEMRDALRGLVDGLSGRLRRRDLRGRIVTLTVRYPDSMTSTHSRDLSSFVDRSAPLLDLALQLLDRSEAARRGVRSLHLEISGFGEDPVEQLDLFPPA